MEKVVILESAASCRDNNRNPNSSGQDEGYVSRKNSKKRKISKKLQKYKESAEFQAARERVPKLLYGFQIDLESIKEKAQDIRDSADGSEMGFLNGKTRGMEKALPELTAGLQKMEPCLYCEEWKIIHQGICHIRKGLDDIHSKGKRLEQPLEEADAEEMEESINDIEEGLKRISRGINGIL